MLENNVKRIVVKVGTTSLTHPGGGLDLRSMENLARVLSDIKNSGRQVILVTSGAVGFGVAKMRLPGRPSLMPMLQAAAAVGQCELMHLYDKFFMEFGHITGQILLTRDDIDTAVRRQHLENTFFAMLDLNVIPIVNENDSVAVEEFNVIGENDTLSAIVAIICKADLLVIMSDIDGLFDSDPHKNPGAKLISVVDKITDDIVSSAGASASALGKGGMSTKITAAKLATEKGIPMVICNSADPKILYSVVEGERVGTRFMPKK